MLSKSRLAGVAAGTGLLCLLYLSLLNSQSPGGSGGGGVGGYNMQPQLRNSHTASSSCSSAAGGGDCLSAYHAHILSLTRQLLAANSTAARGQQQGEGGRTVLSESSPDFLHQLEHSAAGEAGGTVRVARLQASLAQLRPHLLPTAFPVTRDTCHINSTFPPITRGPMTKMAAADRFTPCQTSKQRGLCAEPQPYLRHALQHGEAAAPRTWTYLVLVKDGCVTGSGDFYNAQVAVHIKQCRSHAIPSRVPGTGEGTWHEALFSLAQYWGYGFGHWTTEDLPRIGPFIELLRASPHIRLHVPSRSGFVQAWLGLLGISADRLVTGAQCAHMLYVPEGSGCGGGVSVARQMLAKQLHGHSTTSIPSAAPPSQRTNIVFIERTRSRVMRNRREMASQLQLLAARYNFTLYRFTDGALPALPDAQRIMSGAFLIFTNHGAGEGNMLLAPPGTLVFECSLFGGNANGSFHKLSVELGHKLFTYISQDCNNIPAATLMEHLQQYLELQQNIVTDTCPLDAVAPAT